MKRVIVTGGNGFVGRPLVRRLIENCEVCVLDNLRSGRPKLPTADNLSLVRVDIREPDAVAAAIADFAPDVVVHLAAIHYIPECENNPDLALSTNEAGTLSVLRSLPAGTRFVIASTAAVYAPSEAPHRELSDEIRPSDVYGYTKLHCEAWTRYYTQKLGLASTIVRLFNVAGPGETNPHVLPAILKQIQAGETCLRLGNTTARRDYIHTADASAGFATVALADAEAGECDVVNLGTGKAHSVKDLVTMFAELTDLPLTVQVDQARLRKVDRPYMAADISLIRERYGWTPRHEIRQAIADLVADPDIEPAVMQVA
jgi:UDP-glucose 4-epimerase